MRKSCACLIRRLRAFCGKEITDTTCIATSATIVDPEPGSNAGAEFAARFFGVSKDNVEMVTEKYEPDLWADSRQISPALPGNPAVHLKNILDALSDKKQIGELIKTAYAGMTNQVINPANWEQDLYEQLASNELVFQIAACLRNPRLLKEFIADLERRIGRKILEEEILCWLALGAASRKEHRPLLRPVVHGFVRGVSGAVVTFPVLGVGGVGEVGEVGEVGGVGEVGEKSIVKGQKSKSTNTQSPIPSPQSPVPSPQSPKLWLSAEDATNDKDSDQLYRLPVMTCTTCGQHYFNHHLADFSFFGKFPGGGQAVDNSQVIWPPLAEENGGKRVVLLDRLITSEEEADELDDNYPKSTVPLHFCRYCGTLHSDAANRCYNCGRKGKLVTLLAVKWKEKQPGQLSSCVACQSLGRWIPGGYREPAREVRAIAVSDVHVLAQNMLQYAERRRLLVFADNRQDAAFQAGWMQDHARRFRLRSLMYERIQKSAISVGDLTAHLDDIVEADDDLSRALIPEVWRVARKEAEGVKHSEERRYFLRIQVLREIATGVKQRIGLEPWGRLKIEYGGLSSQQEFFTKWSSLLGIKADELVDGIASLLDINRRSNILLDREGKIFSKFWQAGDFEIQRGYLPLMAGIPKGLKLRREPSDNASRINQWLSDKGDTLPRQVAKKWGIDKDIINDFYDELWQLLTAELALLVPVTLTGNRNRALSHCAGACQIDVDKLRLTPHKGVYRCNTCRRVHLRPTPKMSCMAWRCNGTIKFEPEDQDNYNLMVLDQPFIMLRSREHSAQVPAAERETLERMFKSDSELVNTLVCTPTLELGVNIGGLDAVLMRNVPPLPANYKQRAGRAGREHRMAVNLTYARQASHDRAYYNDPLKLLQGTVYPPAFNLRNPLMVEKHVHAAVLTILNQLVRSSNHLISDERQEIVTTLGHCFPNQVKNYLFENNGNVRTTPLDVSVLNTIITKHQIFLFERVREIFSQNWPETDASVVTDVSLNKCLLNTEVSLTEVIKRVWTRLQWALQKLEELEKLRQRKGTLDPDDDALRNRCDRLIKKLKGIQTRKKREAEGYDDTNTYSVLAAEGFLPGYGLDVGSVLATAQVPRTLAGWISDFELPRPSAIALREYIPGNLIYANGNRFIPRFFHLEPQQQPVLFQVDVANEALVEIGTQVQGSSVGLGVASLRAIPICDVDLPHQSQISDDEDYRFQMPVSLYGYEQNRHNGGRAYLWQDKIIQLRQGVHLRLVNVGAAKLVRSGGDLGYPVCLVCGQSRSPLASEADRQAFAKEHLERCGQPVQPTGFFADVVADTLSLQNCENREIAYSIVEAIRLGAANILDMEVDDLQVLIIAHPGKESVDALLYDPMPGGSGLLEQIISRWLDVIIAAQEVVAKCPSACETSCVDCLQTFRNAHYHRYLNRHTAAKKLNYWGYNLTFIHDIPPVLPVVANKGQQPVNDQESALQDMLLRAGFPQPITQYPIDLGKPLGTTTPDFFYTDPSENSEGICIYLDGMSKQLHGDPDRQQRDRIIREELLNRGFEVFVIPVGSLGDRQAMASHFFRIARVLLGKGKATEIRDNPEWFS